MTMDNVHLIPYSGKFTPEHEHHRFLQFHVEPIQVINYCLNLIVYQTFSGGIQTRRMQRRSPDSRRAWSTATAPEHLPPVSKLQSSLSPPSVLFCLFGSWICYVSVPSHWFFDVIFRVPTVPATRVPRQAQQAGDGSRAKLLPGALKDVVLGAVVWTAIGSCVWPFN